MQPNANHFKTAIWVCMALLFIMIFELPYGAYVFLKWIVSLALLGISGFFLRPATNFLYSRTDGWIEFLRYDQTNDTATGFFSKHADFTLDAGYFKRPEKPLTIENSELLKALAIPEISEDDRKKFVYISDDYKRNKVTSMPPVSEPMAIILMTLAIAFNPLTGIKMHKDSWNYFDLFTIGMLISALVMISHEVKGARKPQSIFTGLYDKPAFPDKSATSLAPLPEAIPMSIWTAIVIIFVMTLFKISSLPEFLSLDMVIIEFISKIFIYIPAVCFVLVILICLYVHFISCKGLKKNYLRLITVPYFLTLFFLVTASCVYSSGFMKILIDDVRQYKDQDDEDPDYDYDYEHREPRSF